LGHRCSLLQLGSSIERWNMLCMTIFAHASGDDVCFSIHPSVLCEGLAAARRGRRRKRRRRRRRRSASSPPSMRMRIMFLPSHSSCIEDFMQAQNGIQLRRQPGVTLTPSRCQGFVAIIALPAPLQMLSHHMYFFWILAPMS